MNLAPFSYIFGLGFQGLGITYIPYHNVLGIMRCTFVDILTYLPMMSTYT